MGVTAGSAALPFRLLASAAADQRDESGWQIEERDISTSNEKTGRNDAPNRAMSTRPYFWGGAILLVTVAASVTCHVRPF